MYPDNPKVWSASQWGRQIAPDTQLYRMQVPQKTVVVHHTVTSDETAVPIACRGIDNYHRTQRDMTTIAYSWLVGQDGEVAEGRGWGIKGAHTSGWNDRSHAISAIGNFTEDVPSDALIDSYGWVIAQGVLQGKIARDFEVIGHKDTKATGCPGDLLYARISDIEAAAVRWLTYLEEEDTMTDDDIQKIALSVGAVVKAVLTEDAQVNANLRDQTRAVIKNNDDVRKVLETEAMEGTLRALRKVNEL